MDSKQLMMVINAGLFGIFETIYRATQNQSFHLFAMTMLFTTLVFAAYNISDLIACIWERKSTINK